MQGEIHIINYLLKLWFSHLRYRWSALRHWKSIKTLDCKQYAHYIPQTRAEIPRTMRALHQNFVWTKDGLDRLFDSIDTPASCWHRAFNTPPLKDDCDGFHAALYWALAHNFPCRLLTAVTRPIEYSHSTLIIQDKGSYHLANYTYLSPPLPSVDAVQAELKKTFYKGNEVHFILWELSIWDTLCWKHTDRQDFLL